MAPLPLSMTGLAADLLDRAGAHAWLQQLAAGATPAVALPPYGNPPSVETQDSEIVVRGEVEFLLDGVDADVWLLRGRQSSGPAWFVCPASAGGVEVSQLRLVDETRHAARLVLSDARLPADHLIAQGSICENLEARLLTHAALALAADSAGGAQAILDKTLEHLRVREQFSRPIGSFQALKHRAADLHLKLVSTFSLLEEATLAVDEDRPDAATLSLLAGAQAADAYAAIAEDALQLHGGIGFTRDHDAHIHLKRAKLSQALLGGPASLRDRAAGLHAVA
jgi:alkylation response protein AidB-like acyl-CoA dehydrogenase